MESTASLGSETEDDAEPDCVEGDSPTPKDRRSRRQDDTEEVEDRSPPDRSKERRLPGLYRIARLVHRREESAPSPHITLFGLFLAVARH